MHGHLPPRILTVPRTPARADSHHWPSAQPCPAWLPSPPEGEAAVTCRVIDTGGQPLARRRPPRPEGTHTYSPATYTVARRENRPLVRAELSASLIRMLMR